MTRVLQCVIDRARVEKRSAALQNAASKLLEGPFGQEAFKLEKPIFDGLAAYYFLISDAYKQHRVAVGHRTKPPKIAAISSIAIAVILPIRPADGVIRSDEAYFVNPALAMRWSSGVVDHPFHLRHFEDRKRFYQALIDMKFDFAQDYAREFQMGQIDFGRSYNVVLKSEHRSIIDTYISMFEILESLKIVKK